jgi:hypothetical protein
MLQSDNFWYVKPNSPSTPILCLNFLHLASNPHKPYCDLKTTVLYLLGAAKPGGGGPPAGNPGGNPPNPGGGATDFISWIFKEEMRLGLPPLPKPGAPGKPPGNPGGGPPIPAAGP